jgi:hypothetical protein
MPLTQIPSLQDPPPAPPPTGPDPAQLELYGAEQWESAYSQMHDFPTLLIQAQDDLSRSRKREAFWMSLFAHAVLLLLILHPPDFAKYWFKRSMMIVKPVNNDRHLTFVDAAPDKLKVKRPDTDKISDKNRIASSKQPQLDRSRYNNSLSRKPWRKALRLRNSLRNSNRLRLRPRWRSCSRLRSVRKHYSRRDQCRPAALLSKRRTLPPQLVVNMLATKAIWDSASARGRIAWGRRSSAIPWALILAPTWPSYCARLRRIGST